MGLNWNSKVYLNTIIFMIPPIILSVIILCINRKSSNLESIISSPDQISSECYNLTYSFINEQKSDEKYLSLNSYLKSFIALCIVIIIVYFIKIFYTVYFSRIIESSMKDSANAMFICFIDAPGRILSFIPLIICVILLRVRSNTNNCEVFMNYYNLCSAYYGDSFKNNFSSIMNIRTYTLWVVILFVLEIVYHAIVAIYILAQ